MEMARDAGAILVDRLGRAQVSNKGDIDLVTEADLASEQLIIERIKSHYPRHAILAEESGDTAALAAAGASEWKWIVDPLDGTTNYAHGYPCFCVSIALERAGKIEVAVIYDPSRDEMFAAERGQGALLNERRLRVSDVDDLNRAMLCTGFPYNVRERPNFARHFAKFTMEAQAVRRDGSAALDLAYLASGRFEPFGRFPLRSAGGHFTHSESSSPARRASSIVHSIRVAGHALGQSRRRPRTTHRSAVDSSTIHTTPARTSATPIAS